MNEKQRRNDDLQERLFGFAVRVLDVVASLPISIPSFPFFLHHSLLDIRYSRAYRVREQGCERRG